MIIMSLKAALEDVTQRKIGVSGGAHYITIPKKWGKKGETVFVAVKDEKTLVVSRDKKICME